MKNIFFIIMLLQVFLTAGDLQIQAMKFYGDEQAGLSVFSGDVKIKKGMDELNASKVSVYIDTKKKPTKFVAEGNVSFNLYTEDGANYKGRSQKAIYLPNEKTYNFYTDVYLQQTGDTKQIQGDLVILKLLENKAYAKGATKKPVVMTFEIDDKKEEPKK